MASRAEFKTTRPKRCAVIEWQLRARILSAVLVAALILVALLAVEVYVLVKRNGGNMRKEIQDPQFVAVTGHWFRQTQTLARWLRTLGEFADRRARPDAIAAASSLEAALDLVGPLIPASEHKEEIVNPWCRMKLREIADKLRAEAAHVGEPDVIIGGFDVEPRAEVMRQREATAALLEGAANDLERAGK
jgi:hypothetical protein